MHRSGAVIVHDTERLYATPHSKSSAGGHKLRLGASDAHADANNNNNNVPIEEGENELQWQGVRNILEGKRFEIEGVLQDGGFDGGCDSDSDDGGGDFGGRYRIAMSPILNFLKGFGNDFDGAEGMEFASPEKTEGVRLFSDSLPCV